jgi:hypothetical protein
MLLQIIIFFELIGIPCLADEHKNPPGTNGLDNISDNINTVNLYNKAIRIIKFEITPKNLLAGHNAKLEWQVDGAEHIFIKNDIKPDYAEISPKGKMTITPLETTNYTLIAYGRNTLGASAVTTIDVTGQPPLPTVSLNVEPESILAGEMAQLKWETHYADTVSFDNGIGAVGSFGILNIEPVETTTYILSATGLGGIVIKSITITVEDSQSTTAQKGPGKK